MSSTTFLILAAIQFGAHAQFRANTQQFIVDIHNTFRSKVAKGTYVALGITKPAGSNILKMKWDATLAASAQAYANTYPLVNSNTPATGVSIYTRYTTLPAAGLDVYGGAAAMAWQQEFQQFGWESNTFTLANAFPTDTTTAHGTQMTWATTESVGCGVKNCGPDPQYPTYNRAMVVCHYKTLGNILNLQIYKIGPTCSECPAGTTCEMTTGLCA